MVRVKILTAFAAGCIVLIPPSVAGLFYYRASSIAARAAVHQVLVGDDSERHLAELDPVTMSVIEEVSMAKFAGVGQQKEAFDFLWTPGLLLRELLQEDPLVSYPDE